jgi:hypothetical protein
VAPVLTAVGLLVPGLYVALDGGVEGSPALQIAMLVLLFGVLAPQVLLLASLARRWLPMAVAGLGIALFLIGGANSGFDGSHPRPDTVLYTVNPATGQAHWATADRELDEWTSQLVASPSPRTLDELLGAGGSTTLLSSSAPFVDLPAPVLFARRASRDADVQTLRLHLLSPRQAWRAYIIPGPGVELVTAGIGDAQPVAIHSGTLDVVGLPPDGIDVTLTVRTSGSVSLVVVDGSIGLPNVPGAPPQPKNVMPNAMRESLRGYATYVPASFVFP